MKTQYVSDLGMSVNVKLAFHVKIVVKGNWFLKGVKYPVNACPQLWGEICAKAEWMHMKYLPYDKFDGILVVTFFSPSCFMPSQLVHRPQGNWLQTERENEKREGEVEREGTEKE